MQGSTPTMLLTPTLTFNMAKNLDSPGLSELIYFTDAVRDKEDEGRKSDMPENHRAVDWLDFNGSYVHLQDAHQAEPETTNPESKSWLSVPGPSMRRDSTPTNLMTSEWPMSEQDACTSPSIYSPKPEGDSKKAKPLGLSRNFGGIMEVLKESRWRWKTESLPQQAVITCLNFIRNGLNPWVVNIFNRLVTASV